MLLGFWGFRALGANYGFGAARDLGFGLWGCRAAELRGFGALHDFGGSGFFLRLS